MNENAMWELAAFLKQAAESPSANTTAPEWLSELNGLPVEDYAQDLCRVLRIGLFNGLPEISEFASPAPTIWVDPINPKNGKVMKKIDAANMNTLKDGTLIFPPSGEGKSLVMVDKTLGAPELEPWEVLAEEERQKKLKIISKLKK